MENILKNTYLNFQERFSLHNADLFKRIIYKEIGGFWSFLFPIKYGNYSISGTNKNWNM